jgi:hypothetical protein
MAEVPTSAPPLLKPFAEITCWPLETLAEFHRSVQGGEDAIQFKSA